MMFIIFLPVKNAPGDVKVDAVRVLLDLSQKLRRQDLLCVEISHDCLLFFHQAAIRVVDLYAAFSQQLHNGSS